jgi:tetratricopeptide (TPR) repeat protein
MTIMRLFLLLFPFLLTSCSGIYPSGARAPFLGEGAVLSPETTSDTDTACAYFSFLQARNAELTGQLETARAAYEQALICDQEAEHVMRNLAVLLVRMGKKEDATLWLKKISNRQPADAESIIFIANLFNAIGQSAEAIDLYQRVLERDPKNFNAAMLLGTIHVNQRQYEEAREVLERLVEADPDSYIGHFYLAKLHQELNEFEKAQASYREALARNWSEGLALELADLYESKGLSREAISLYREILAKDETSERARGGLAGVFMQLGELDQALGELQKLRNYATDTQKVDFAIGRLFIQQGRFDEAVRQFDRILTDDPEQDGARYLTALIHYEQKNFKAAEELVREISATANSYADATLLLIRIMEEKGAAEDVEKLLLERLSREETARSAFYVALAIFYQEQERPEQGLEIFTAALERYPDDAQVVFRYGMFLERRGESAEAMKQMQRVLALEPDNPYALNYVGYTWADEGVNLELALTYIKQAVTLKPQDGFIRDSLGWVYFRLGNLDQALIELEQAIALEPEDPNIHEHLGDVYLRSGNFPQARENYLRALELYDQEEKQETVRRKFEAILD